MNLTEEMRAVVANLREREWIQGEMRNGEAVCAFLLDMYDRAAVLGLRPAHPLTHQLSPERKDGTT